MKETKVYARHGDLSFSKQSLPKSAKLKAVKSYTLALGEATGHHHVITALDRDTVINVMDFATQLDDLQFEVTGGRAVLKHEEHKPIVFEPGQYVMKREREYDFFLEEIKQVAD